MLHVYFRILGTIVAGVLIMHGVSGQGGYLPYPNGPFYGLPSNGRPAWKHILPFTLMGKCEANKTYTISKVSDFFDHLPDLECIWSGAYVPTKIPVGPLYATCLTSVNTPLFNPFIEAIWDGKYIKEEICNGTKTLIGWNAYSFGPTMPFLAKIRHHNLNLAPLEYDDGRPGIVVEYHHDVMKVCPELRDRLVTEQGKAAATGVNIWSKNIPFMDVIRFVGKQEDGGNIYLLKTYLRDPFRTDKIATTTAFTSMLNYDENANPDAFSGMSTEPLAKSYTYIFPGLTDMLLKMLPFDNLLYTPTQTLDKMYREGRTTGRNMFAFLRDLPGNFRIIWRSARKWMREYRDGLHNRPKYQ